MKFLTFGEVMLRLKAPGASCLFQSPALEATFGGGEANVAVSLANYGHDVRYLTVLPDNVLGAACKSELRRFGVDTSCIVTGKGRMGLYFLETGANQRPSKIVYDREESALALANPEEINWDYTLNNVKWLHITGITPAISRNTKELTLRCVREAKERGIKISCDLNYRKSLWRYGESPVEVMSSFMAYVDVAIANEEDVQKSLGITAEFSEKNDVLEIEKYKVLTQIVMDRFPFLRMIAITLRESHSADWNSWSACLRDRQAFYVSRKYEIRNIVDRVGAGDSFCGGLLHGLVTYPHTVANALEFAVAASCLKHSYEGDFNHASTTDVETLMSGDGSGRVQR